ncbi:MAG: CRISPR-associated endoribonuclease Cas6 [Peptococcaceae bacterium]|nr:CRISPR-associated endoribonuclease Cas6 [Candidatus Syntrophopropionicum ammoniitolerans]
MKLTITLEGETKGIVLPIHHNHFIQAALYQLLDPIYASFLHEQGYAYEKRQFRLFSFSRLLGKFSLQPRESAITFIGPIKLVVLTPLKPISQGIVNSFIMGKEFRIGSQQLFSTGVQLDYPAVSSRKIRIRSLSPIVSYSTLERHDGSKFTYYFEPSERDFSRLVAGNLYRKWQAWKRDADLAEVNFDFSIKPLHSIKRRIIMYKGIVIKGYSGHYLLEGEPRYLEFALNVGLGAKGSQGLGVVEKV